MCTQRDILVFAAGAMAFHTISHIIMPTIIPLPLHVISFNFTAGMNIVAIVFSAAATLALLYFAQKSE